MNPYLFGKPGFQTRKYFFLPQRPQSCISFTAKAAKSTWVRVFKQVVLLLRRGKVAFEGAFIVSESVISEAIQNKKVASTYSPTRTSVACEEEE